MERINILDVFFDVTTQVKVLDALEEFLSSSKNHLVFTPNPEGVMQAKRNPEFKEALNNADLSLADGTGIVVASKLWKNKLPERVRGVDTIFALFQKLSLNEKKFTAYFLGGEPGIAEEAKIKMENKYSFLNVVGFHHGFFDDDEKIIDDIKMLSPDILLVCTEMPRAELWSYRNKENLNTKITMCLGGTLNIMAGRVQMSPKIMRKLGLEWLNRLWREPRRFFRMLDIPRFVFAVLIRRLFKW